MNVLLCFFFLNCTSIWSLISRSQLSIMSSLPVNTDWQVSFPNYFPNISQCGHILNRQPPLQFSTLKMVNKPWNTTSDNLKLDSWLGLAVQLNTLYEPHGGQKASEQEVKSFNSIILKKYLMLANSWRNIRFQVRERKWEFLSRLSSHIWLPKKKINYCGNNFFFFYHI